MRRQLHVKTEYEGFRVDARFCHKTTIFANDFADGRRLFACIAQVCELRGISYVSLPEGCSPKEDPRDPETLCRCCAGRDVVLLDCTRHGVNRGLVPRIKKDCGMIFLILGQREVTPDFLKKNPAVCYYVRCLDGEIRLEEWDPPRTRSDYIAAYGRTI